MNLYDALARPNEENLQPVGQKFLLYFLPKYTDLIKYEQMRFGTLKSITMKNVAASFFLARN